MGCAPMSGRFARPFATRSGRVARGVAGHDPGAGRWQNYSCNGRGHHGSLLDRPGTAVVSCATASVDTTQAARASLAGTAMRDCAVVLVTTVNCGATGQMIMA